MPFFAVLVEGSGLPGDFMNETDKSCGFYTTAFVTGVNTKDAAEQGSRAVLKWFAKSFPDWSSGDIEPSLTVDGIREVSDLPFADAVAGATWFIEDI